MRNSALLACRFRLSRIAVVFPLDTQTGETPQRAANALAPGLNVRPRWLTRHKHCHRRLSHRVCQTLGLWFEIRWLGEMSHPGFMVRNRCPGRCRTLGLWFEIGSSGKMSHPGFTVRTGSSGRCRTLGLWFEQVVRGRCRTLGLWFETVARGRCRTLGLRFETGSPGKMSHPGFMVRNR